MALAKGDCPLMLNVLARPFGRSARLGGLGFLLPRALPPK